MKPEISIQKIKNIIQKENLRRCFAGFLKKQMRIIILVAAVFTVIYSVYIWYNCLYKPDWSEAEVEEYIRKKDKGIIFKKDVFSEAVNIFKERRTASDEKMKDLEDIFDLKK